MPVQAAGTFASALVAIVLVAWLGRTLGPAQFGHYAAVLSTAGVLLIGLEGGWATAVHREAAGGGDPGRVTRLMRAALFWVLSATAVAFLASTAAAAALDESRALPMAVATMGLVALANLASGRLRGDGRYVREAAWHLLVRVSTAAAIVAALSMGDATVSAVYVGWFLALAVMIGLAWPRVFATRPSAHAWAASWRVTLPLIAVDGLVAVLVRADVALLDWSGATPLDLSHYAAATRFNEFALLAFAPGANVLLRHARLQRGDGRAMARNWRLSCAAGLAAGSGGVALAVFLGESMLTTVFGPPFAAAGALLPWVLLALPFALSNLLLIPTLVAADRERSVARALGLGAGALVLAIPLGHAATGVVGAAIGAAFAHAVSFACLVTVAHRTQRA